MGLVDDMMAREMSSEKEARASAVVGGATGRGVAVLVETEAIFLVVLCCWRRRCEWRSFVCGGSVAVEYLGWLLPSLNGCVIPERRDRSRRSCSYLFPVSFCCGCGAWHMACWCFPKPPDYKFGGSEMGQVYDVTSWVLTRIYTHMERIDIARLWMLGDVMSSGDGNEGVEVLKKKMADGG